MDQANAITDRGRIGMLERIIFAIDSDSDPHVNAKFLRHVDTQRALGNMSPVSLCMGSYNGVMERSYMVLAKDFQHVQDYVTGQESILRVPGDVRQPCVLEFLGSGERVPLSAMRKVDSKEAMMHDAWTYHDGGYYVC
jgi:hypothetical protein